MLKPEIRIIAWDDCAFGFRDKRVRIIGAIFRGGGFMDGLLSTEITKDGFDVTEKICDSVTYSRHYDQLSLIMLNGVSFAGFNIVDVKLLSRKTKLPVIIVMRRKPDMEKFKAAMRRLGGYRKRLHALKNAGMIYKYKNIFYQKYGITRKECGYVLKLTCTRANIPEPLRVAHLIASGLSREMHGRSKNAMSFNTKPAKKGNTLAGYESRGRA